MYMSSPQGWRRPVAGKAPCSARGEITKCPVLCIAGQLDVTPGPLTLPRHCYENSLMTLPRTTLTVLPEWIDHNGHMNVAYYVLAFDLVTDTVYETWGLGLDYPEREKHAIFTLGMNIDYVSEVFDGEPLSVTTQLLDGITNAFTTSTPWSTATMNDL
ncbi:MAG: hypothetical protein Ct9H300mP14_09880 [Gammaproteobacteria bacterium]|nr:MAG: hypothetical protein Ct9H300mP14_09880 [Gammaproteobacteria bacterium]